MARAGLICRLLSRCAASVRRAVAPRNCVPGVVRGLLADVLRSKKDLLAEDAMLRQQLVVAARRLKRARFNRRDRVVSENSIDANAPMPEFGGKCNAECC
jgi:hypothetical protein